MAQNITDEELQMIETVQTEQQWSEACLKIKRARQGAYPPDWWPKVKTSGLMDRVVARFGATSDIRIE